MAWKRGRSYAQDLRDRVLAAVDDGMPVYQAAPLFRVSVSYIYKVLIRRRRTGETAARPQRNHQRLKLAPYHEAIRAEVAARPDATLEELRAWLAARHGVASSVGGVWTTLRRLGLTLRKSRVLPRSRSVRTSPRRARSGANARRT